MLLWLFISLIISNLNCIQNIYRWYLVCKFAKYIDCTENKISSAHSQRKLQSLTQLCKYWSSRSLVYFSNFLRNIFRGRFETLALATTCRDESKYLTRTSTDMWQIRRGKAGRSTWEDIDRYNFNRYVPEYSYTWTGEKLAAV